MRLFAMLSVLLALAMPAAAFEPATTGVVVMHGKWGNPSYLRPLRDELTEAGFLVEAPEMAWSGSRLYDKTYTEALGEIAAAAARLKARGAQRIVLVGHSLGGNAAIGYSAMGGEMAAMALLAPAHLPEGGAFLKRTGSDVAKARAMVAEGKGEETSYFTSWNTGDRNRSLSMRAAVFLSFYDPEGPAAMSRLASKAGPAPILWLAATTDVASERFAELVWPHFPATTPKTRVDVTADHIGVVTAGRKAVVEWLKGLE